MDSHLHRLDIDSSSLHSLGPLRDERTDESVNRDDVAEIDATDAEIRTRYEQLKIELYSVPCYAASSQGPLPINFDAGDLAVAYRNQNSDEDEALDWKPAFSGKRQRRLLMVALWSTILLHFLVSRIAVRASSAVFGAVIPPISASLLAGFTVTVVAADIRREGYRVPFDTVRKIVHSRNLRWHRWLVLYLLAPLLSVPLLPVQHLSKSTSLFLWPASHAGYYTFSSWEEAVQHFGARLPDVSANPSRFWSQSYLRGGWKTWSIDDHSKERDILDADIKLPAVVGFKQTQTVIDGSDDLRQWEDLVSGQATIMPLFPVQPFEQNVIAANIRTNLNLLSTSVSCRFLSESRPWVPETWFNYSVGDCMAVVRLTSQPIDQGTRMRLWWSYIKELNESRTIRTKHRYGAIVDRMDLRIQQLMKDMLIINSTIPLQMYQGGWFKAGPINDTNHTFDPTCDGSFIFVGDVRPFRTMEEVSHAEGTTTAAFCQLQFTTQSATCLLSFKQNAFAKRLSSAAGKALGFLPKGAFDIESVSRTRLWQTFIDWMALPDADGTRAISSESAQGLSKLLASQVPWNLTWHKEWPMRLLRHTRYDTITNTKFNIAPLVLGSKILSQWMATTLSESADLALEELIADTGWSRSKKTALRTTKGSSSEAYVAIGNFGSSVSLKVVLIFTAGVCTLLIWSSGIHANDTPSGYRWSVETVAAKATLLAHSRLKTAFASSRRTPDELRAIRGLRIGYWTSRDGIWARTWSLDSRCNQIVVDEQKLATEKYKSSALWQRYNKRSLPAITNPYFNFAKLVLLGGIMATGLATLNRVKSRTMLSNYLPMVLKSKLCIDPGWGAVVVIMMLPQVFVYILFAWWSDINLFYRARRPWAGLAAPNPAKQNITLNYMDGWWWILKAILNRHYNIVLLGVGCVVSLSLPLLAANLFKLEAMVHQVNVDRGKHYYEWNWDNSTSASNRNDSSTTFEIPPAAIDAVVKPPNDFPWIFEQQAILPISLDTAFLTDPSADDVWKATTRSTHSFLKCIDLKATFTYAVVGDESVYQPQILTIKLPPGITFASGENSTSIESCGGRDRTGARAPIDVATEADLTCSRWISGVIRQENDSETSRVWIVTYLTGRLDHWAPQGVGPLLKAPSIRARTVMCVPRGFLSRGSVSLSQHHDDDSGTSSIRQHGFKEQETTELPDGVMQEFDQMLYKLLHRNDTDDYGINIPQPLVESSTFIGDILGYLVYRSLLAHKFSYIDLGEVVSHVYSTLFAVTVADTDWLRTPIESTIDAARLRWSQSFHLRLPIFIPFTILIGLFMISAIYLAVIPKKYIFPMAPEPMENAFFFLYQSTLLDHIRSIPHPERMTIERLSQHVVGFRDQYVFGFHQHTDRHYEQFGVDVAEEFEARPEQGQGGSAEQDEYRDGLEQSEDGVDETGPVRGEDNVSNDQSKSKKKVVVLNETGPASSSENNDGRDENEDTQVEHVGASSSIRQRLRKFWQRAYLAS